MKYYKVVNRKGNRLYSCLINFKTANRIEYSTKFWAEPAPLAKKKGYLLLCFANLDDATEFICINNFKRHSPLEIWECEIKKYKISLPSKLPIWDNHNSKLSFFHLDRSEWILSFPRGSIMAEQVKLIKKIS